MRMRMGSQLVRRLSHFHMARVPRNWWTCHLVWQISRRLLLLRLLIGQQECCRRRLEGVVVIVGGRNNRIMESLLLLLLLLCLIGSERESVLFVELLLLEIHLVLHVEQLLIAGRLVGLNWLIVFAVHRHHLLLEFSRLLLLLDVRWRIAHQMDIGLICRRQKWRARISNAFARRGCKLRILEQER